MIPFVNAISLTNATVMLSCYKLIFLGGIYILILVVK